MSKDQKFGQALEESILAQQFGIDVESKKSTRAELLNSMSGQIKKSVIVELDKAALKHAKACQFCQARLGAGLPMCKRWRKYDDYVVPTKPKSIFS